MATHDVIQDSFTSITKDVKLHVLCKQTHVLLMLSFQSSRQQMNITFAINGICTLANVINVNPICVNFVS
jgi:hypothetical protein